MVSGVGVLDKSMTILGVLAEAEGARALAEVAVAAELPKPTAHRLLVALEVHGLVRRDQLGAWTLGGRLVDLGRRATAGWPLADAAAPALQELRRRTGESVQLYVRDGDQRRCLASLESAHELRTIVNQGALLPLEQGSAGRVLAGEPTPTGWIASVGERQAGVASVSAPVEVAGEIVAAVGVSGPIGRLGTEPGPTFGPAVLDAAAAIADRQRRCAT